MLKQKFCEGEVPNVYSFLPRDRFPQIVEFAYQIFAVFGSTYVCKQLFSFMKGNKTREIMADGHTYVIHYKGDFSTRFKGRDTHPW